MYYRRNRQIHRPRTLAHPAFRLSYLLVIPLLLLLAGPGQAIVMTPADGERPRGLNHLGYETLLAQREFQAGYRAYEMEEYSLARRHWEPMARQGHARSQYFMGLMHDVNSGAVPNADQAFRWYARAARQGMAEAQQKIALAYARGEGVSRDMHRALDWWLRAARQGNADSQYNLGVIYAVGNESVPRDILKAAHWWRQAALGGDAMAQYNLGALYANGDTGERDLCEAIHWWRKSEQNGLKRAQVALHTVRSRFDPRRHCASSLDRE